MAHITESGKNERVARPRAELKPDDLAAIQRAVQDRETAQLDLERAIVRALDNGASVRVITAATGIAGSTIVRYAKSRGTDD